MAEQIIGLIVVAAVLGGIWYYLKERKAKDAAKGPGGSKVPPKDSEETK